MKYISLSYNKMSVFIKGELCDMDYIALLGISVGLAMDAFAVSITNGVTVHDVKLRFALQEAFMFGTFQSVMPIIGWMIGKAGELFMNTVGNYVSFGLLSFIGGKMIYDCFALKDANVTQYNDKVLLKRKGNIPLRVLLLMAVATSIDALATGVILPSGVGIESTHLMMLAALIIGIITFIMSFLGVFLGKFIFSFNKLNKSKYLNLLGGLILIGIGLKILFGY